MMSEIWIEVTLGILEEDIGGLQDAGKCSIT